MVEHYRTLVRKIFYAYLNNRYMEYNPSFGDYQYLVYHKLDMVFFSVCKNIKDIDPKLFILFKSKRDKIEKVNKLYQDEVSRLILNFNNNGIKYAILKGWACLVELYHNQSDRYFGDVDILVDEQKLSEVERILFDNGYQYGIEKEGKILRADREKVLFQRYFTHEIYNMVKKYEDYCINIDVNFRFSWRGENTSVIGNIKLNDINEFIVSYTYENRKYSILDEERFFIHLCCHLANEAWFFHLNLEYAGGDPEEIYLFRILDICLLLRHINTKRVWEIAIKMDCIEHLEFLVGIIKVVMGEKYCSQFFGEIIGNEKLNKYMTNDGKWKEWPISIEERVFDPEVRKLINL